MTNDAVFRVLDFLKALHWAAHDTIEHQEERMNFLQRAFHPAVTVLIAGFALWLDASTAVAQGVRAPKTIKKIDVEYIGSQSVGPDRILSHMSMKVGDPFTQAAMERDIKSLYSSGLVNNIRILSEEMGANGVRVVVVVQTRSGLAGVDFKGNTVFTNSRLASKVELKVGGAVDEAKIQAGQREIRKMYQDAGYGEVAIRYEIVSNGGSGLSRVVYHINEGGKSMLHGVEFVGNSAFTAKELRKEMKSQPTSLLSFVTKKGKLSSDQLDDDVAGIERYYRNHGYLNASVVDVRRVRTDDNRVDLVLTIDEGSLFKVDSVRVKGARVFSEGDLGALLTTKAGQVFSAAGVEKDIEILQSYYSSKGYADVSIEPQLESAGAASVNVSYVITEGAKYYTGQVHIEGNDKTKDKVIRNELAIIPGDPLSTPRLQASKRRLENTGYFGSVDVIPIDTGSAEYKDVRVTVTEKPTGSLNFGAGFSSIDNFVGFVEVTQTNFDIGNWPNFTGGGQRFRAAARVGTERKDFIVSWTEPWFLEQRLALGTELFYRDLNYLSNYFDERNYGGSVSLRKAVGQHSHIALEYKLEDIRIGNLAADASPQIQAEAGDYQKSSIGLDFINDTRDDLFLTRKGRKISLGANHAGLGGSVEDTQFEASALQYFHLPFDMILSLDGQVRAVEGDQVPIFDRLFLGGANNLRGFDYRDVGPRDINGEPLGGRTTWFASAELTVPVIDKVRSALFYDAGLVSPDEFSFDGNVNSDWGVGLRLYLPVGPIRLDYAFPITSDGVNDSGGRFNFNIGYRF